MNLSYKLNDAHSVEHITWWRIFEMFSEVAQILGKWSNEQMGSGQVDNAEEEEATGQ